MGKKNIEIWTAGGVDFCTIKCFADYVGVTPSAVYRWVYRGMPVLKSTMDTYLIPMRAALDWVEFQRGKSW